MITGIFPMARPVRNPAKRRAGVVPATGRIPIALLQAVLATPDQERFALPGLGANGLLALALLGLHDRCAGDHDPAILTQAARMPMRARLDATGLTLTLDAAAGYDPALDGAAAHTWLEALELGRLDIDAKAVPLLTSRLISWFMAVHATVAPVRVHLHGLAPRPKAQARALTLDRWLDLE